MVQATDTEAVGEDPLAALTQAQREAYEAIPQKWRDALPRDDAGEPIVEIEYSIYRYVATGPNAMRWDKVRDLDRDEWDASVAAHATIYKRTKDVDRFPSFAWDDLQAARSELHRRLHRKDARLDDWMPPLVEYRVLGYSTALWMYYEYILAEVNRRGDETLKQTIKAAFSDLYDRSRGYRIVFCLRNAFQHGVRDLVGVWAHVAFADGSDTELVSASKAPLDKEKFAASKANAKVRGEVRALADDEVVDLFALCEEAHAGVRELHSRIVPLLHPDAPTAARLLADYMREAGYERPHFHAALRGVPHAVVSMHKLDVTGFNYVVEQIGGNARVDDDLMARAKPPGEATFRPRPSPEDV